MKRSEVTASQWVVKIGSGVLLTDSGAIDQQTVQNVVADIEYLRSRGIRVTIISSGAVALGRHALNETGRDLSLPRLQALAATGQAKLMQMYDDAFAKTIVAQVLLTRADLNDRRRYINARMTLAELHRSNVVPIVNENDTVATDELRFGDNDQLAAMTAHVVDAGVLVVLSVAKGFRKPNDDGTLGHVSSSVKTHDPILDSWIVNAQSQHGTGGMRTKLDAARFVALSGTPTIVADGKQAGVLRSIHRREIVGTFFEPSNLDLGSKEKPSKSWIAFNDNLQGSILCDSGARRAIIKEGASLLPAGVRGVKGTFLDGALVALLDHKGVQFARGVAVYPSTDIEKIAGKQSSEILTTLGYLRLINVVHRDSLVLERDQK